MSKLFDLAIIIGRFQPLHNGHVSLFRRGKELADRQLIVIGSSHIARNTKNPFTYHERTMFIEESGWNDPANFLTVGITDDAYNDQQWVASVQNAVEEAKSQFNLDSDARIILVGHTKDASSYYLKMFPSYAYEEVESETIMDATDIRNFLFEGGSPRLIKDVPEIVRQYIYEEMEGTQIYNDLCAEYKHIKEYRAQFANLPYPPVFVTCDAVVICHGHILLVKRRSHPGKGLWALPGGFLNANERIVDGIIRELEEETRIKISHDLLKANLKGTHVFDAPYRSLRGRTITNAGLIILNNVKELPGVRGSDDAERAKWFPISEFYQMSERMFEDHYSIGTYMINRAG